jgi:hypothetical protein
MAALTLIQLCSLRWPVSWLLQQSVFPTNWLTPGMVTSWTVHAKPSCSRHSLYYATRRYCAYDYEWRIKKYQEGSGRNIPELSLWCLEKGQSSIEETGLWQSLQIRNYRSKPRRFTFETNYRPVVKRECCFFYALETSYRRYMQSTESRNRKTAVRHSTWATMNTSLNTHYLFTSATYPVNVWINSKSSVQLSRSAVIKANTN